MERIPLTISCDTCERQFSDWCRDCVVTALCDRPEHDAVVLDLDEERAIRLLAAAGLIPAIQHREAI